MNSRSQLVCAACALVFPVVFGVGFWPMAGFLPPLRPDATVDIVQFYRQHAEGIKAGMIFVLASTGLYAAFVAAISAQMRRIEQGHAPVLTYLQLIGGFAVVLFLVICALIWSIAAFRPDRSPDVMLALDDIGWFFFVMPFSMPCVQNIAIGSCILSDRGPALVFPRWLGFLNIWAAVTYVPAGLLAFFKTGPFAWNGLLAFWIPAVAFFVWVFAMAICLIKATHRASTAA